MKWSILSEVVARVGKTLSCPNCKKEVQTKSLSITKIDQNFVELTELCQGCNSDVKIGVQVGKKDTNAPSPSFQSAVAPEREHSPRKLSVENLIEIHLGLKNLTKNDLSSLNKPQ